MFKRSMLIACVALAAVATVGGTAVAQENATLLLRSGERVSGQLVDMGADFTMKVGGQERRIAINDVLVIDFVGGAAGIPDTETSAIREGQHMILLRSGGPVYGRLIDITGGGPTPLRLIVEAEGGRREIAANEIGRVFLGNPGGTTPVVATTGRTVQQAPVVTDPNARLITVPATQRWVDTGITTRRGQTLQFETTGEVRLSEDPNDVAGSAGSLRGRTLSTGPLPGALAGALIGRVGNGPAFGIGNQTSVPMDNGRLFLGVNDDELSDNSGQFYVVIRGFSTGRRR